MKLDKRYSFTPEYVGHAKPRWVARFCGQWISHHATEAEAMEAARAFEVNRWAQFEV